MDILSDHRITALIASERELANRAEYVRVALERAERLAPRRVTSTTGSLVTSTGSLMTVPSASH
jgi:hypothetical protein